MSNQEITFDEVESAYRKLKSYLYYDYANLENRNRLASFEAKGNVKNKLSTLALEINKFSKSQKSKYFDSLLMDVGKTVLPKSFFEGANQKGPILVTNSTFSEPLNLKKVFVQITAPVELLVISVLWCMKIGYDLDKTLSEEVFSNRLCRNKNNEPSETQLKIFNPYYINFQGWRDKCLNVAKKLHQEEINSTIISLDIKDFFYNVDIDLTGRSLDVNIQNVEYLFLNLLLKKIHLRYKDIVASTKNLLPIGLPSSYVLANWALTDLDEQLKKFLKPAFYGRYVDDILLVMPGHEIERSRLTIYLEELLKQAPMITVSNGTYHLKSFSGKYQIADNKVRIYHQNKDEPITFISQFEERIKRTASEAQLLSDDPDSLTKFENEVSSVEYDDNHHKLRSVNKFSVDQWGISSTLTNLIETTKIAREIDSASMSKIDAGIQQAVRNHETLGNFRMWEKAITFYVINKKYKHLSTLLFQFLDSMVRLNTPETQLPCGITSLGLDIKDEVLSSLKRHLIFCVINAFAANSGKSDLAKVSENLKINKLSLKNDHLKILRAQFISDLESNLELIMDLRKSYLVRHHFCTYPILTLCDQADDFDYSNQILDQNTSFEISTNAKTYPPRFVHAHELQFLSLIKTIYQPEEDAIPSTDRMKRIFDEAAKNFEAINKIKSKTIIEIGGDGEDRLVTLSSSVQRTKIRAGLVNTPINKDDIINRFLGRPNLSFDRLIKINSILNQSVQEKVDLLIFPECFLPIEWVDHVVKFSRAHKLGIVCGVEHVILKNHFCNFLLVALPHVDAQVPTSFMFLVQKTDYNKLELDVSRALKLQTFPALSHQILFDWSGSRFSLFNCLELSDINKRARLAGKVDFVVAVENNKDTAYFSSVVESTTRDLSCYVVQVNNSTYGDSRLSQPTSSVTRDVLKIKGGKNSVVIVDEMDIDLLRAFHLLGDSVNELSSELNFKPKPPNFSASVDRPPHKRRR